MEIKWMKRISFFLALVMVLTMLPVTALAVTSEPASQPAETQSAEEYTVALTATDGGRVSGGGAYAEGEEVTASAHPADGYQFDGWYDGRRLVSLAPVYTFAAAETVSYQAAFTAAEGETRQLTVTCDAKFASSVTLTDGEATLALGTSVTLTFTDESKTFLYWVNDKGSILSTAKEYTFILAADTAITAKYAEKDTENVRVVFRNAYAQIVGDDNYSKSAESISVAQPTAPARMGHTFDGWYLAGDNGKITDTPATNENILAAIKDGAPVVVLPKYSRNGATYTVTVTYENVTRASETYADIPVGEKQNIRVPAEIDGQTFRCWKIGDEVVGYDVVYSALRAQSGTMALTAVYGEAVTPEPIVNITQTYAAVSGEKYVISNTMQYYVPLENAQVIETGFVYGTSKTKFGGDQAEENLIIGGDRTYRSVSGATALRGLYTFHGRLSKADTTLYIRAYVTYKVDGEILTKYSTVVSGSYYTFGNVASVKEEDNGGKTTTATVVVTQRQNDTVAATATVPQGVKLANNVTVSNGTVALTVTTEKTDNTNPNNITMENLETANYDVSIVGVSSENKTPIVVCLQKALPLGLVSVSAYHSGVSMEYRNTANLTEKDTFYYDPTTGDVYICVTHFSNFTFGFVKATAVVDTTPAAISGLTYNGEAQALVTAGNATGGTMQYSLDGENYSATVPTAINAGDYTVYYKVMGDANHNDSAAESVDVTIAKASITPAVTLSDWTYGEAANTPAVTGNTGNGAVTYYYKAQGADDSTYTATVPTAAGTYTVKAVIAETANYSGFTVTSDFTIQKAAVTAPAIASKPYNGANQTADVAESSLYTVTNNGGINVGAYDVVLTLNDTDNYKWPDSDNASKTLTFNIAKANAAVTAPTAKTDLTYTGSAQELVNAGSATGGTMQYKLGDGEWGTAIPTATAAGTYTVNYRVVGDSNHNDISLTGIQVTIAKAAVTVTANDAGKVYGADDPVLTATVTGLVGSDKVTYTISRNTGEAVGEYAITPAGDVNQGNYTVTYVPATFTIAQREVTLTWGTSSFTYDGQPHAPTATAENVVSGDTVTVTVTGAQTNAGEYTATATALSNPNYKLPANGTTATFTISPATAATFTHSDNLAHTDTYLYRVGNGNTVTLGTLFKASTGAPTAADVKIQVQAVNSAASVSGTGTNLEDDSNAQCAYTRNNTNWTQSTLKFTGEGPVQVTIKEGNGTPYTLNLEVVTGNNYVEGATINGNANIVLLGNTKVGASSGINEALYLREKTLYGNGFEVDCTGSNISTKGHGIIGLENATLDNVNIIGPTFSEYQGNYKNDYYASTVKCQAGTSYIYNCRITGASSPLRIKSDGVIKDTVLSGGLLCNMEFKSGSAVVENLTTINTQNSMGIVFGSDCTPASITINGTLTQHNFVSENAEMGNSYATTLKNAIFGSNFSGYQFSSGGTKYVNTGIVSMSSNVGADNIIDNRTDIAGYAGKSTFLFGVNAYVYTVENSDPSRLETSYTEPAYVPAAQTPYAPVFSWKVPDADNVAEGGDAHCYKHTDGTLRIQFLVGGSKTLNLSDLPTCVKYGKITLDIGSITCVKDDTGVDLPVTNGLVTFTEAGNYTVRYTYSDNAVYGKDATVIDGTSVLYTKEIPVQVNVKKQSPNAVITASTTSEAMIWGSAGSSWDRDYQPAAPIFRDMTITDYDDNGNPYTVLDGSSQTAFLNSIASVTADSDNKTGFTINFPDGTKLVIKCGAPYNSGTLEFKKYNNEFLMCGSVAYNNPSAATWKVTSYTYTGRNGVAVSYTTARSFTSTTDSTNYSLSNLSTNKFLMYNAQGGSVSPTYTGTTPATLPTPTREGYTFQNWNTKVDGTGTEKSAGTSYSFSTTTTLYAIWAKNVEVSFSSEESIISTISAGAGTTNTLPAPTKTTQWLEGWYTAEDGGTKIGAAGASFTMPSADTTYYAYWSPKYTVTYDANGGTVGTSSVTYEGTALTLPTPTNGTKTFEGWFTAEEDGTKIGAESDSYTPTENITLYAHWSDNIKVTFNGNGGTSGTNSDTYDHVTPITLPAATWAGHQFNGWYTASSGGTEVGDTGASYAPTEPTTLYAQWTAYTVSFDGNGATNPSALSAGSNGSVTLPTPTRTGYTFNGWYTEASGGTKIGNGGASYTPTADITLHAQWTQLKFTVTISAGSNGSVSPTSIANVPYGKTITVSSNTLTINGTKVTATADSDYSFDKWDVSNGATVTKNMTITASFKSSDNSCLPSGTLITLADGTQKPVEDVKLGDLIMTWDFETGGIAAQPVIFYESVREPYNHITLTFDDGSELGICNQHALFDYHLRNYAYIDADTAHDMVGRSFMAYDFDSGTIYQKTVTNVSVEVRDATKYEMVTAYNLNYFSNTILGDEGRITGYTFFDVTEDFAYDPIQKQADIETYGLFTYEEFSDYMSETQFNLVNGPYFKQLIQKGYYTMEHLFEILNIYVNEGEVVD